MHDKTTLLGYPVDLVDMDGALSLAGRFLAAGRAHHIITLNPEMIVLSRKNETLRLALSDADTYLPETAGVAWALGTKKLPGIDFMYELIALASAQGRSVYFLGAKEGIAERAAQEAARLHPGLKIAGARHGYFSIEEEDGIVSEINVRDPDILLVAMGTVPQETFIRRHKNRLKARIIMGVGGSFDVLSGNVVRAPEFFRRYNIEWFYRLITQPRRFWRMASTLPLFVVLVWKERLTGKAGGRIKSDGGRENA
ncbi:MAG: WecB/TagA/CpsF family glycosyltransferase [Candidatus Aquicultorales bacterium]